MRRYLFSLLLMIAGWCANAQNLTERPAELRSANIPESQITHVQVTPGSNVATAFANALEANYVEGNSNYLQFDIPPGTYELQTIPGSAIFKIQNKQKIIINGNGSTIIGKQLLRFFECNNSENIILKNFFVDYDPLPFTQGTIRSVNAGARYINVSVDNGYPNPVTDTRFQLPQDGGMNGKLWLFVKDPTVRGMMKRGCSNVYIINKTRKWEVNPSNNNQVRIYLSNLKNMSSGDKWVMPISSAKNLVRVNNSNQITVEDLTQYSGAGALVYGGDSKMINLIRMKSILKPNTDRIQANTRDGAIFSANTIGPLFDACEIEANGDDGINMNVSGKTVESVNAAAREIQIASIENQFGRYGTIKIEAGDSITIFKASEEKELFRGTIATIEKFKRSNGQHWARCTVNENIPGNQNYQNCKIFDISKANNLFVVRNSKFRYLRRHAMFLYGRRGIVEGNTFERNTVRAIETVSQGRLGYLPEDIQIRNNYFYDNNVSQTDFSDYKGGPILLELTTNPNDDGANANAGKPIKGIQITGNTFDEDFSTPTIYMTNCTNSSITGNTFESPFYPLSEIKSSVVKIKDADVAFSHGSNSFSKVGLANAQVLRYNSQLNSATASSQANEIAAGGNYQAVAVDNSGNIYIKNFGKKDYFVPDSLAKNILGDNPRTIQLRFRLGRDISSANTEAEIFRLGEDARGKQLKLYLTRAKRFVLDLGDGVRYRSVQVNKDFTTHTKIDLGLSEGGNFELEMDGQPITWAYVPQNYTLNTSSSDFEFFKNNSDFNGVTIYSIRAWNYNLLENKSTHITTGLQRSDDATFTVYPSPVSHRLFVESKNASFDRIEIINMNGQVVKAKNTNSASGTVSINCTKMQSGAYMLRLLKNNQYIEHFKFHKK